MSGALIRLLPYFLLQVHEKPNAWAEVWLSFQDNWESILGISMHIIIIIYDMNHVFTYSLLGFEMHKMPSGRCSLSGCLDTFLAIARLICSCRGG